MADETARLITLNVSPEHAGMRLDAYLAQQLAEFSRSHLQKMIVDERVHLNDKPARAKVSVKVGDVIQVRHAEEVQRQLTPVEMSLDVLYEDDHLIVLNKPAGLSVHPGADNRQAPTLVHALLHHCKMLSRHEKIAEGFDRPGIVHRLDKDTSGVIVCAKDDATHDGLAQQFRKKTNLREYVALLDGCMSEPEIWRESYLHRDSKNRRRFASIEVGDYNARIAAGEELTGYRWAKTRFQSERTFGKRITFAKVQLLTGRTHQIRVHAKDLHLPVVGDQMYRTNIEWPKVFGKDLTAALQGVRRQMLHASLLGFEHPILLKKMAFAAPLPRDFNELLRVLEPILDPT